MQGHLCAALLPFDSKILSLQKPRREREFPKRIGRVSPKEGQVFPLLWGADEMCTWGAANPGTVWGLPGSLRHGGWSGDLARWFPTLARAPKLGRPWRKLESIFPAHILLPASGCVGISEVPTGALGRRNLFTHEPKWEEGDKENIAEDFCHLLMLRRF